MAMIEIKNVSKWYGSFQVLKNCSTSVEKGEVVVVCGPSGSGKSTLIKTVNALEPFQQGEVLINGDWGLFFGGGDGVLRLGHSDATTGFDGDNALTVGETYILTVDLGKQTYTYSLK